MERQETGGVGRMLYMVIERFKNQDATPVYDRFPERGRMTQWTAHWRE